MSFVFHDFELHQNLLKFISHILSQNRCYLVQKFAEYTLQSIRKYIPGLEEHYGWITIQLLKYQVVPSRRKISSVARNVS